jgi:hypothetical protein
LTIESPLIDRFVSRLIVLDPADRVPLDFARRRASPASRCRHA